MNKLTLIALLGLLCVASAVVTGCKTYTEPAEGETQDNTSCAVCEDGYYHVSTTNCAACTDTNCGICATTNAATCDVCKAGYGVDADDACEKCTDTNCASCTISGDTQTCALCKAGYNTDNEDGSEAADGKCTACSKGCATCAAVDGDCITCPSGSEKNSTDKENIYCCAQNCSTCSSATQCLTCKSGSSLNDAGACVFGFKTGASLTLGAVVSLAILSLLF